MRLCVLLVLLVLTCAVMGYSNRAAVRPAPQLPKICETEIGAKVGAVTYEKAREVFLKRGFKLSKARDVVRPSDIEGSIVVYGRVGKWLYVTKAEVWYDPDREVTAYARLEGVLHNGQQVNIDIRDQLPEGFKPVNHWREIASVSLKHVDGRLHRVKGLAFEIIADGSLMQKESPPAEPGSATSVRAMDFGATCNNRGAVTCNGMFCINSCSMNGNDCHCNYYIGVCMTSVGLACGGDCPNFGLCTIVTPNPGIVTCGCIGGGGGGGGGGGYCDPYFDSGCSCIDDFGFPDPFCIGMIGLSAGPTPAQKK